MIRCVGVEQLVDRHVVDGVHLGRADDRDLGRLAPPAEHRRDREVARRQPQLGQPPEDLDAARVEPDLLLGLAQRGLDRGLAGVDRPARERDLPGVRAHVVRALGEQQLAALRALAEQHEYGAPARVAAGRRREPGQLGRP